MGRPERNDQLAGWFHVLNRGAGHRRIFHTAADGTLFVSLLGEAAARTSVEVHAFCLIPNHFHLLLHCPDGGMSTFMQHVAANFTRAVNSRLGTDGPMLRGRFRCLPVDTFAYVQRAGRYIHRNASDLPGAPPLAHYRWSSYRQYVGTAPALAWLTTDVLLGMHADLPAFRSYVEGDAYPGLDRELVWWAARIATAERGDELLTQQGLDRAVVAAVCGDALDGGVDARTRAVRRAIERQRSDPLFRALVDHTRRLLGQEVSDTSCTSRPTARVVGGAGCV